MKSIFSILCAVLFVLIPSQSWAGKKVKEQELTLSERLALGQVERQTQAIESKRLEEERRAREIAEREAETSAFEAQISELNAQVIELENDLESKVAVLQDDAAMWRMLQERLSVEFVEGKKENVYGEVKFRFSYKLPKDAEVETDGGGYTSIYWFFNSEAEREAKIAEHEKSKQENLDSIHEIDEKLAELIESRHDLVHKLTEISSQAIDGNAEPEGGENTSEGEVDLVQGFADIVQRLTEEQRLLDEEIDALTPETFADPSEDPE